MEYVSNLGTLPEVAFLIGVVLVVVVGKSTFNLLKVCVKFSELKFCCCNKKLLIACWNFNLFKVASSVFCFANNLISGNNDSTFASVNSISIPLFAVKKSVITLPVFVY